LKKFGKWYLSYYGHNTTSWFTHSSAAIISQAQSANQVQNLHLTFVRNKFKSMSALCYHLKIHSSFPCYQTGRYWDYSWEVMF
jgi:hypothetical protein